VLKDGREVLPRKHGVFTPEPSVHPWKNFSEGGLCTPQILVTVRGGILDTDVNLIFEMPGSITTEARSFYAGTIRASVGKFFKG
jgi:hypothetical protein